MPDDLSELSQTPLSIDLLNFYDEFVEIHDYCFFLCEAFTSLVAEDNCLDIDTAMGASRFCNLIKQRMQELKGDLKQIHKKAYTQNQTPNKAHNQKPKQKRKKPRDP